MLHHSDFLLDDVGWREVFSKPGGFVSGCLSPKAFLTLRIVLATMWMAVVIWSLVSHAAHGFAFGYWWIKLTHLSAFIEECYLAFAVYSTFQAVQGVVPDGSGNDTPWFVSVTWVLASTTVVASIMAFVFYWLLLYIPSNGTSALACIMHGGNFVIVLVDILCNRLRCYLQQVYSPLLFSGVYAVFTYIYYVAGGTDIHGNPYIYKAIDWRDPTKMKNMLGLIVLAGVPAVYTAVCVLVACRIKWRQHASPNLGEYATA